MEVEVSSGNIGITQINSVENDTVVINCWAVDAEGPWIDLLLLPNILFPTYKSDVIPKPSISSLAFVFNHDQLSTYRVRYVRGMKIILATKGILNWFLPYQSVSYIIFEYITQASLELQRVLNN